MGMTTLKNSFAVSTKAEYLPTLWLKGIYPTKVHTYIHQKTYTRVL